MNKLIKFLQNQIKMFHLMLLMSMINSIRIYFYYYLLKIIQKFNSIAIGGRDMKIYILTKQYQIINEIYLQKVLGDESVCPRLRSVKFSNSDPTIMLIGTYGSEIFEIKASYILNNYYKITNFIYIKIYIKRNTNFGQ